MLIDQFEMANAGVIVVAQCQTWAITPLLPCTVARSARDQAAVGHHQHAFFETQACIEVNLHATQNVFPRCKFFLDISLPVTRQRNRRKRCRRLRNKLFRCHRVLKVGEI